MYLHEIYVFSIKVSTIKILAGLLNNSCFYLGWPVSVILRDMKETGSPKLLFENLNLTPIDLILWTDLHKEGPRRLVEYDPECDLRVLLLR